MLDISDSVLGRDVFAKLLEQEFHIHIHPDNSGQIRAALDCLQVFDSWKEFYEKTGWKRDNPEEAYSQYLIENRICRVICGRIWYFSRLVWEEPEKGEGEQIATVLQ